MLSDQADKLLNSMVKEAKRISHNGVSRSRIIEHLIINANPIISLKSKAKELAIELNTTQDRIKTVEDQIKEK